MKMSGHQRLAAWIFGSLSFAFLLGVFVFGPEELPVHKHKILAILSALLIGLFGAFMTGSIRLVTESQLSWLGKVSIQAGGGVALFLLVLFWWNSPLALVHKEKPPLKGSLDILVWDPDEDEDGKKRRGLDLNDPLALPLQVNDQIQIQAKVNRPAFLYLFWISGEGEAIPLYPWQAGDWDSRPSEEKPQHQLLLPGEADEGWPIQEGPSSMESVILLVREDPLPDDLDLKGRLADLPSLQIADPFGAVVFENWMMSTERSVTRGGIDPTNLKRIRDPLLGLSRVLQGRLGEYFDYSGSVSFESGGE